MNKGKMICDSKNMPLLSFVRRWLIFFLFFPVSENVIVLFESDVCVCVLDDIYFISKHELPVWIDARPSSNRIT